MARECPIDDGHPCGSILAFVDHGLGPRQLADGVENRRAAKFGAGEECPPWLVRVNGVGVVLCVVQDWFGSVLTVFEAPGSSHVEQNTSVRESLRVAQSGPLVRCGWVELGL